MLRHAESKIAILSFLYFKEQQLKSFDCSIWLHSCFVMFYLLIYLRLFQCTECHVCCT